MELNADFSRRVLVHSDQEPWQPSPSPGVERRMLDRIGGEVARATSIVRFAPGQSFSPHTHGGGEEFIVLDGVFQDEHGDYPAGTYVRNPIGTSHTPHIGPEGATILVKLCQFDDADTEQKVIDARNAAFRRGEADGQEVLPLHSVPSEDVTLQRWAPGTVLSAHAHPGGQEIFVLEGSFSDEHGSYPAGTWIRNPHMFRHEPRTEEGCVLWTKTGHLPRADAAA